MKKYLILFGIIILIPLILASEYGYQSTNDNGYGYDTSQPTGTTTTIISGNGSGGSSGNPFDQSLNTTDDVRFHSVGIDADNPSTQLQIGTAYPLMFGSGATFNLGAGVAYNIFFNATSGYWTRKVDGAGNIINLNDGDQAGDIGFYLVPNGSAGTLSLAPYQRVLYLKSNGQVLINTGGIAYNSVDKLQVNGSILIMGNITANNICYSNGTGCSAGSMNYTNIALTNKTNVFNASQNISGNLTINNTLKTASNELIMEETGDQFGAMRFKLRNRNAFNGVFIENPATNAASGLAEFGLTMYSGTGGGENITRNIRVESRDGWCGNNNADEIQIGNAGGSWYMKIGNSATSILGRLIVKSAPDDGISVIQTKDTLKIYASNYYPTVDFRDSNGAQIGQIQGDVAVSGSMIYSSTYNTSMNNYGTQTVSLTQDNLAGFGVSNPLAKIHIKNNPLTYSCQGTIPACSALTTQAACIAVIPCYWGLCNGNFDCNGQNQSTCSLYEGACSSSFECQGTSGGCGDWTGNPTNCQANNNHCSSCSLTSGCSGTPANTCSAWNSDEGGCTTLNNHNSHCSWSPNSCTGSTGSACSDWSSNQGNCEAYANHGGECTWNPSSCTGSVNTAYCDTWDGDGNEASCVANSVCGNTAGYCTGGGAGGCSGGDCADCTNSGDCGTCGGSWTASDCYVVSGTCSTWDTDQTSCEAVSCSYSATSCTGTLTCGGQLAQGSSACNAISCSWADSSCSGTTACDYSGSADCNSETGCTYDLCSGSLTCASCGTQSPCDSESGCGWTYTGCSGTGNCTSQFGSNQTQCDTFGGGFGCTYNNNTCSGSPYNTGCNQLEYGVTCTNASGNCNETIGNDYPNQRSDAVTGQSADLEEWRDSALNKNSWIDVNGIFKTSDSIKFKSENPFIYFGVNEDTNIQYNGTTKRLNFTSFDRTDFSNITINNLIKLEVSTLPACATATNGSIGRNSTGLFYCNNTGQWSKLG